jgi:predicted RNA-binding Zn ribbon-like protein
MVTGATPLYRPLGAVLCLDFVNSIDRMVGKAPVETLTAYADLCLWSEQSGSLPRARVRRLARVAGEREGKAVLARAVALREALFRAFLALTEDRAPAAADLALDNAEVARALARLRVEPHGAGFAWEWSDDPDALDAPLWPVARSAAELLVSADRARVRRCASATCLWLFLDTTKNGRRRWCEMAVCGNRAKVRAHRKRAARRRKT